MADVTMFGDTDTGEITVAWVRLNNPCEPGDCGVFRSVSFRLRGDILPEFFYWWGYDLSQPHFSGDST